MNEKEILKELRADLQLSAAQQVIYLEGKTDVDPFFGLIGVARPRDDQHQGVLVKGLKDEEKARGSGGSGVRSRIIVARTHGFPGVSGIIDGDGRPFAALATEFDHPASDQPFSWKAYCIENLLAKCGWPTAWGAPPDWNAELAKYAPYVALNRIHAELWHALKTLDLAHFSMPGSKLKTADGIRKALAKDKHLIREYDVEDRFNKEHAMFLGLIASDQDELHARLNGKWLVTHLAPIRTKRGPDQVRSEWAEHARSSGGLPEVRELWQRITRNPPY